MGFLSGVLGAATGFLTGGPAGAAIGGISGFMSDDGSSKADDYSNSSLSLQQAELRMAQDRVADYNKAYKPIEDAYLKTVKDGVTADYEGVTNNAIGDVNSQFEGAEAARLRQMARTGVNPNSGRADALGRSLSLSRGLALAGSINKSRQQETDRADNLTFARQQDAVNTGVNKLNSAQANATSASTALSQTYANKATQAQTDASNSASSWANLGSTVYKAWDQYNKKPATTTIGTGTWM